MWRCRSTRVPAGPVPSGESNRRRYLWADGQLAAEPVRRTAGLVEVFIRVAWSRGLWSWVGDYSRLQLGGFLES